MLISENQELVLGPPGCVDGSTEYLTPTGWKRIDSYDGGIVGQYDLVTGLVTFVQPIAYIDEPCEQMFHIKTKYGLDQMLSFGHRVLWYSKNHGQQTGPFTVPAAELYNSSRRIKYPIINIPTTFIPPEKEGLDLTDAEIRVMVAVIADGCFKKGTNYCTIHIKKSRKHDRLRKLLTDADISFTEYVRPNSAFGYIDFKFNTPRTEKHYTEYWWNASVRQLQIIADELPHWDGTIETVRGNRFSTLNSESADFAQYAFMSLGVTARKHTAYRKDKEFTEHAVICSDKTKSGIFGGTVYRENFKIVSAPDGRMYCFEVPSSYLVLRRNGCVFVTGNTGKTTTILNNVDKLLQSGEEPDRIAFVSFTRKAITEAVDRACGKFELPKSRFPLFKTIHATCFAQLGISKKDVMSREHYKDFGEQLGYRFDGTWDESEGVPAGSEQGDQLLFLDNLARISERPLREIWEENYEICDWDELVYFQDKYQEFKSANYVMDFTDMLYAYISMCDPVRANYVFVDEAQDLSPIQWKVLKHAFSGVKKTTISGDDDQSIYRWSGADVRSFLSLGGGRRVLDQSYRLPREIHRIATNIVSKIENRFSKEFRPRDADGNVDYKTWLDSVELDPNQSNLLLVRNVYILQRCQEYLMERGIPFIGRNGYSSIKNKDVTSIKAVEKLRKREVITGKEAKAMYENLRIGYYLKHGFKTKVQLLNDTDMFTFDALNKEYGLNDLDVWYKMLEGVNDDTLAYYRAVLANGYSLNHTPTTSISTIHAAKGGEADHVVLLSDMASKSYNEWQKNPDDERRVAYVGVTRAKEKLTIIEEQGKLGFPYYTEGELG